MAYTNAWTVSVPAGSAPANQIDDYMRRTRLDIQERLLSVFDNMTDDPVVVKDSIKGKVIGKRMIIPYTSFVLDDPSSDAVTYEGSDTGDDPMIIVNSSAGPVRASVILPGGITITRIQWLLDNTDSNQITLKLLAANFAVGSTLITLNSMIKGDSGEEIVDSGTISIPISDPAGRFFWLWADKNTGGGPFHIKAVQLVYTTPDSRFTL